MTVSMAEAIEASSLASVKEIAANPPSRPRVLPRSIESPLVLYIARVPGSRDVFLTPMKPREKVVTAADVQSSLYYVHVNSPYDYAEGEPAESYTSANLNEQSSRISATDSHNGVCPPLPARRPVAPLSPPHSFTSSTSADPSDPQRRHQIVRKPVLPKRRNPGDSPPLAVDLPQLPPRPLPTPPADPPYQDSLHADNTRLLRQLDHSRDNNPYSRDYSSHPETLKQLERDSRPEPDTLTLIRRDPSSSEQWNVATIHDPPVHEVSSFINSATSARRTKKSGAPLYLDITNPGYATFDSSSDIPAEATDSRISMSSSSSASVDAANIPPPADGVFLRRRLYMPGSRYGEHSYSSNSNSNRSSRHQHNRSMSSFDSNLMDQASEISNSAVSTHSSRFSRLSPPKKVDRRSKGYTFASPWPGGRCEFSTGATGRSLRCQHTFLPSSSKSVDAAAAAAAAIDARDHSQAVVQDVSELRFNLPSSSKNAWDASETGADPDKKKHRSSYFAQHLHRHSKSKSRLWTSGDYDDYNDDEDEEKGNDIGDGSSGFPRVVIDETTGGIDLTLGREKAGGGFGGKRAKLGKLIIEPQGFQMLDLLVAANLALWWRAYERV